MRARQQDRRRQRRRTHDDPRPGAPVDLGQFCLGLSELREGEPRSPGACAAGSRGDEAASGAFGRRPAGLLFELADGALHGGLGEAETARGEDDVLGLAHGDERAQLRGGGGHDEPARELRKGRVQPVEGAAQAPGEQPAALGQEEPLPRALEEGAAAERLVLADRLGDGGLRDVAVPRSRRHPGDPPARAARPRRARPTRRRRSPASRRRRGSSRRAGRARAASRRPRASSPEALARRVAAIEASDFISQGWSGGDAGHGPASRFEGPFGHIFEIYWETVRYAPPSAERPALKNIAPRFHARWAAPRRHDHLNLLAADVREFSRFMQTCLGSRVTEYIQLDKGRLGGCSHRTGSRSAGPRRTGARARPRGLGTIETFHTDGTPPVGEG